MICIDLTQVIQLQQQQPNWERQITEIIDWVGTEKEARNYLQQMAATMTKVRLSNNDLSISFVDIFDFSAEKRVFALCRRL